MSSSILGNSITLTRGDTLRIGVTIYKDGEIYEPEDGDVIRFSLKHNKLKPDRSDYVDAEPLITKIIPNDTMVLTIEPEDTKGLAFMPYVYDVQITFNDGTVDTFIPPSLFTITEEVE